MIEKKANTQPRSSGLRIKVRLREGQRLRPRGFHPYWEKHAQDWTALKAGKAVTVDLERMGFEKEEAFFLTYPMLQKEV